MIRRAAAAALCLVLLVFLFPGTAPAEEPAETIRVGWYDTPFNYKDAFGRRTGYAYAYQRKIAAYTGWKFEYVEGTWSELLQMLRDGRIDLLSDVSYTEERGGEMLFSSIPMGSESYCVYVSGQDSGIRSDDPSSLEGKKVGITGGTIQVGLFRDWLETRGLRAELVLLDCPEQDSLDMLRHGELDAFVTLDSFAGSEGITSLWEIGESDFYFAVSRDRPDVLSRLNAALVRIQEENRFFNEELSAKYLTAPGLGARLTGPEAAWLESHGPIRVGYQDGYLAFCASDLATGELTGALKDYLELASVVLGNAQPAFTAVAYPTAAAAIQALQNGEIDCMFPANLTDYDGEQAGIVLTAPLMRSEMAAVVRSGDRQSFLRKTKVRVGVNRGNPNYEMFLLEHYPDWTPVYFPDTPACLDAVSAGRADCIIVSSFRYGDIAEQCGRLNLAAVSTGVQMDYCFAVREGSTELYSILSRIIRQVPDASVNASLTYYSLPSGGGGFFGVLRQHPSFAVLGAVCLVLVLLVVLLAVRLRKAKKPPEKSSGD